MVSEPLLVFYLVVFSNGVWVFFCGFFLHLVLCSSVQMSGASVCSRWRRPQTAPRSWEGEFSLPAPLGLLIVQGEESPLTSVSGIKPSGGE